MLDAKNIVYVWPQAAMTQQSEEIAVVFPGAVIFLGLHVLVGAGFYSPASNIRINNGGSKYRCRILQVH